MRCVVKLGPKLMFPKVDRLEAKAQVCPFGQSAIIFQVNPAWEATLTDVIGSNPTLGNRKFFHRSLRTKIGRI